MWEAAGNALSTFPCSWLDLGTRQTSHKPMAVVLLDATASSSKKWSETWEKWL